MKSIKVYSTPSCPYCRQAKDYIKSKGFAVEDVNVAGDANALQEMVNVSGQRAVPVIKIDDKVIVGFNRGELDKALGN